MEGFGGGLRGGGLRKAAVLILALDRHVLSSVVKHLRSDEVSRLMEHLEQDVNFSRPDENELKLVINEFLSARKGPAPALHLREAMEEAFGEHAADHIMRNQRFRTITEKMEPQSLARILQNEGPQLSAAILAHLPHRYAADVLAEFPAEARAKTVERLAAGSKVTEMALDAILKVIEEEGAAHAVAGSGDKQGGVQVAAAVLNQMDAENASEIVRLIRQSDPDRATAIEQEMFHFHDVLALDGISLEKVLGGVEMRRLATALKGLPDQQREAVFKSLPESQTEVLRDEMESLGRVPAREVHAARREIVNRALELDREGQIRARPNEEMMG